MKSLPGWCHFFIDLGEYVGTFSPKGNRIVVALALPTRIYGAIFTAFGLVGSQVNTSIHPSFEKFYRLKKGDKIYYQERMAFFQEITKDNGIRIIVPPDQQDKKTYRKKIKPEPMTVILPQQRALEKLDFTEPNTIRYLIIGTMKKFQQEFKNLLESFDEFGQLKIHRFHKDSYNSEILPIRQAKPEFLNSITPHTVIFDGANTFLKSREYWLKSHNIVLLDRTEPHFQEAVDVINQNYYSRFDDVSLKRITLPFGVEHIAYQEKY
jgi:hypothetical protein